jgi:monoamine oxidase
MRLPEAHKCVNNYVNNIFKLPVEVFSGFSPKGYYYLFGKAINIGEYMKNPLPTHKWLKEEHGYDFNAEMLREKDAVNIADMWEHTFQALLKETGYGPSDKEQRAAWEKMCEKYDIAFGDYLITYGATEEGRGWKSGTMELFGLIGSGIGGYQSTFVSSFLENVREEISLRTDISNPDSANFHEIIGGNDKLPYAIASEFTKLSSPKKLVLGATVIAIRDNHAIDPSATGANRYTVTYRVSNSNVECEKSADFIMLTIPFTALRTIEITPAWPTDKARAIRELHYQFASKVMLEFNNRWWNDENGPLGLPAGGALSTDLMLRNVYFPDHSKDTGRGVVLASYTWEDDALWWASKSRDQQVADALSQLHKLISALPVPEGKKKLDVRRYFSGGDIKSWSLDPHVSGAYAFFNPGQMSDIFDYITENVGLIFFAGEHASFDHAWIEGAIQSGIREAIRIHKLPEGATGTVKSVPAAEPTKTEEKHSEKDKKDKKSRKDSLNNSKDNLKDSKDKLKEKEKSKDKEKEKEKEKEKSKEKSKSKSK